MIFDDKGGRGVSNPLKYDDIIYEHPPRLRILFGRRIPLHEILSPEHLVALNLLVPPERKSRTHLVNYCELL